MNEKAVYSPAVYRWLEGSGVLAPKEVEHRLGVLNDFCAYVSSTPDQLVADCLRTAADGQQAIKFKRRAAISEAIMAFVTSTGRLGHEAVVTGNIVRSFLTYNGVFLPARASID